ncbi:MAG: hypothetical protein M1833_004593 [Piccolia ochrophora]|nr:MAG: hypothetical protein M1833_004593 [Piccolia ochrophora]
MRQTNQLLAIAKAGVRFLESGSPTGLTGLATHPAPRPALQYLYSKTLEKLSNLPESSVYRQSTESLTKHRLKLVEDMIPGGYDEWIARTQQLQADNKDAFDDPKSKGVWYEGGKLTEETHAGKTFVTTTTREEGDVRYEEWDGEPDVGPALEGTRTKDERVKMWSHVSKLHKERPPSLPEDETVKWEPEPPLDADQISELENQIGAGLIEEVIRVAEGELNLVDQMEKTKSWEELEEKPSEGQWEYFERGTNTGTT